MPRQKTTPHRELTVKLLIFAVGMFAFGFLVLPPLYDVFCEVTGFGGRTNGEAAVATEAPDPSRTIRVEFMTTVNQYAPWDFAPDVDSMDVHPGKLYFATFTARNLADTAKTGQAVPSIAPVTATEHFRKIECFCFTRQAFAANEKRPLPLSFIVDAELPEYIDTVTLSYTLFDTESTHVTRAR